MQQMHDGPVGGHFGAERTLSRLKNRYYWYNMKDDVTLWCRTCTSCAERARPLKTPQAAMGTVRVGAPMERIAVDLMGPLNETERHNRFILVVQDYFSKWVEAYPVSDEQAPTVAEKVVAKWVCRYGAPQSLHSDQGTNFESAVFQGMCELFGIKKTHTTPFHPQSDGQVERFNATLQKALATTAERCHWDWDIMIPYAVMAYWGTKHSSTGLTPNMMLLGREITEPIDLIVGLPANETPGCTVPQYVVQLRERLELSHQLAREALGKYVERAKRQYDKNICQVQYQVGAAVWHLIKGTKRVRHKVRKFLPSYEGPYFVVGLLDDLVYCIKKGPRAKAKVVHHDRLKPYHSRAPLDNSWVFQDSDQAAPIEVTKVILTSTSVPSTCGRPHKQ
uniref:Gypsy retrotransposon integrase-like protein 1 n=1 Tax=Oreochromis niloticus TaxID=8128 RepID=A0A669C4Z6_ORENI